MLKPIHVALYLVLALSIYVKAQSNIGFETGTKSGWTCLNGSYIAPAKGACNIPEFPFVFGSPQCINVNGNNAPISSKDDAHVLVNTGMDPNSNNVVSCVAPASMFPSGVNSYSLRLGNALATKGIMMSSDAVAIESVISVTPQNAQLNFLYAAFAMEYIPDHIPQESARFVARISLVINGKDSVVQCLKLSAYHNDGVHTWIKGASVNVSGIVYYWYYTLWNSRKIDLSSYIGQNVKIQFITADCLAISGKSTTCTAGVCTTECIYESGSHPGYAYIDLYTSPVSGHYNSYVCPKADSVELCAPAGYATYNWPAGQPGIPGSPSTPCVKVKGALPGTTYTVMISDPSILDCSSTFAREFTIQPLPQLWVTPSVMCKDSTGKLMAHGAKQYLWSPDNLTDSVITVPTTNASTLTYTLTGTNYSGCSASEKIEIKLQDCNVPGVNVVSTTVCQGTCPTLVAEVVGGAAPYSYTWSTGDTTSVITKCPQTTTEYTVVIADNQGETASATVSISVLPAPTIAVSSTSICKGQTGSLIAAGAYVYHWETGGQGSQIAEKPLSTRSYSVTGISQNGCSNTASGTIWVNPDPVITTGDVSVCRGLPGTLTVQGAASYQWSTGETTSEITVIPLQSTTYTVTGIDKNGCSASSFATLAIVELPVLTINPSQVCLDSTTILIASGANTYTWQPVNFQGDSLTINPHTIAELNYTVSATSTATGCSNSITHNVKVVNCTQLTVTTNTITSCAQQCSNITAYCDGGKKPYTYLWNNGLTTSSINVCPTVTTQYSVTVTDGNGQSASALAMFNINYPIQVSTNSASICWGETGTLTASGANSYWWNVNVAGPIVKDKPLVTTSYTVTGTDVNGCTTSASAQIVVNPLPTLSVVGNGSICKGDVAFLYASGALNYKWSNGQVTSTISVSPTSTTVYTVIDTANIKVLVDLCTGMPENVVFAEGMSIFPNPSSGRFFISISNAPQEAYMMRVYNVMGELVLQDSVRQSRQELDLRVQPSGVYFVQITNSSIKLTQRIIILNE
jgi:hypothetical protein